MKTKIVYKVTDAKSNHSALTGGFRDPSHRVNARVYYRTDRFVKARFGQNPQLFVFETLQDARNWAIWNDHRIWKAEAQDQLHLKALDKYKDLDIPPATVFFRKVKLLKMIPWPRCRRGHSF